MPLTEQQRNFCREYLKDYSPARAMLRAGYAKSTAYKNAHTLMNNPEVAACLAKMAAKVAEKAELTAERVLEEMRRIAFSDLTSYYKWSPSKKKYVLKALDELTTEQKACISEYKPGEFIRLHSKDGALDKLGKHFKLYTDIDATVHNFVIMPELRIGGKEVIFEVGKPAPKPNVQKKN